MSDHGDENVNSLNVEQSDSGATASVVVAKTPRKAATSSRVTAGKATPGAPSTPLTGARSRTASASLLSTLPAKAKVGVLAKQAEGAARVNVNNWSQQDVFTQSMEEVLEGCAAAAATVAEMAPLLDECMGPLMAALATCTNCNHSATQTRALKCFRLLFEQSPSFKRLDAHLDLALPALLNMVGHNSAAFLRSEGEAMLLCAMRHVNAGRVTHTVARELLSEKHEKNTPKMTALAALAADGLDQLTVGYFPGQKESPPAQAVVLQDLHKNYYKDLIRCVSRLNAMPHQPFRSAAGRMARALVEKGQANFTLTAMLRDLARTDKRAAKEFEALAKEVTGKELPSHTTAASAAAQAPGLFSPGSSRTRARSASTAAGGALATCASPLPPSAAKGNKVYASTMPKEMGSPMPAVAAPAAASAAAAADCSSELSQQSHPLPASSGDEHADYQTAGAGLLDNVSESLCFNYSPTAGGRASAAGAGSSSGDADAPVERQLFAASGRADGADALGLSVLDDDDNIVVLNARSSTAAGASAASGSRSVLGFSARDSVAGAGGLNDSLDVSSGMVYNYNRGSMPMDGASESGARSSMAASAAAAAAASRPSSSTRHSSGKKRKADSADLQEAELCAAADSALSPGGKLRKVGALTAQLKRAKHDPQQSSAAAGQALAAAMRLVADVQASHMARVDAQNKEQQEFWTNMRHNLRSRRNK